MTTIKDRWNIDLARGFDVTMWKAMQSQQIRDKLRITVVSEVPKEDEAKFFASCTAWTYHEQDYRFYIGENAEETVIYVYQEDMSSRNAGQSILIEADKPISYLERRGQYEQIRKCCDEAAEFLFANRVWR